MEADTNQCDPAETTRGYLRNASPHSSAQDYSSRHATIGVGEYRGDL